MSSPGGPTGPGDKPSKQEECEELIELINRGVQSLDRGQRAGMAPNGVADLRKMATAMDEVAADVAKVTLTIPRLQKLATNYRAMAMDVAKAARDMAAAAEANDSEKITEAQDAMERAVKREDPLVDSINKFCQAP